MDEAFPGDIIGLVGHSDFGIGDTLTTDPGILYKGNPALYPRKRSRICTIRTRPSSNNFARAWISFCRKASFKSCTCAMRPAKCRCWRRLGPLQFEVVQFRLESEYGAASRLESAPWTVVRWLPPELNESRTSMRFRFRPGRGPPLTWGRIRSCYFPTSGRRITSRRRNRKSAALEPAGGKSAEIDLKIAFQGWDGDGEGRVPKGRLSSNYLRRNLLRRFDVTFHLASRARTSTEGVLDSSVPSGLVLCAFDPGSELPICPSAPSDSCTQSGALRQTRPTLRFMRYGCRGGSLAGAYAPTKKEI